MNKIYLLGYKARSGKDTLAEEMRKDGYIRYAFADKLKSISADLFDLSDEQIYGKFKECVDERYQVDGNHLTPRYIIQKMGTEVARSIYPDIWGQYVANKILSCPTPNNYVITDFRFPNEYEVIKRVLGKYYQVITIEIFRPDRPVVQPHISEMALDNFPFDFKIVNDHTIAELYKQWAFIDYKLNC